MNKKNISTIIVFIIVCIIFAGTLANGAYNPVDFACISGAIILIYIIIDILKIPKNRILDKFRNEPVMVKILDVAWLISILYDFSHVNPTQTCLFLTALAAIAHCFGPEKLK